MTLINISDSARMCKIATYCAGTATAEGKYIMSGSGGMLEHIVNFFTFGGVCRDNVKAFDEFSAAMTTALFQDACCITIPETLIVDCFGYTVTFTQPGELHNAADPVTIEVRKSGKTTTAQVNKDKFCRVITALQLRQMSGLPSTAVVLADNNRMELQGANLSGANLSGANLGWANLCDASLNGANLVGANLSEANLSEANLNGANLSGANLVSAKLDRTKLVGADLSRTNLFRASLFRTALYGANLSGANLSEANLSEADLSRADLREASLAWAKLAQAKLRGADLSGADLSNIQQEGALLYLPNAWSSTTLDTHLNHINNFDQGSLLTMMDSIDDRHADVKLRMARELMTSLKKAGVNLSEVALPLMDILSKPPYTDDAEINTWLGNLCERYLSRYNGQVLPENEGALNQSIALFSRRPELMSSHNGTFIQIIAQAMKEKSTSAMKTTAAAQYEAYLQLALVKPYCSLADFGDGEGKPDWADKDAINFILLSAQPATVSVMLLSQASLESMLRPRSDTVWNNIYLYRAQNCLSLAQSPGGYNLFTKVFTLFNAPYQYMQKNAKFLLLVKTLNLGSLENTFVFATKVSSSSTKLVSAASQIALGYIFTPKLTHSTGSKHCGLNAAHYEELVSAYELTSASAADKGKTLLCLAALFTKYSSSAIFGTAAESPEALRHYAYALMAKAHGLDESLIDKGTLTDWTNRLLGLNKAFTCSAVLSGMMVGYIRRSSFSVVMAGIMPPAWR